MKNIWLAVKHIVVYLARKEVQVRPEALLLVYLFTGCYYNNKMWNIAGDTIID